jgi:hypothetical protein
MSGELVSLPQALTLEALGRAFGKAVGREGTTPLEQTFLAQAHEDYAVDETPELGGEDLAALLAQVWKAAETRKPGEPPRIVVEPLKGADGRPTGYDVVHIVQDDRPFLVDSVMGELADAGVTVRSLFHPIIDRDSGRQSTIVVVLDPLTQERRDTLVHLRDPGAVPGKVHGPQGAQHRPWRFPAAEGDQRPAAFTRRMAAQDGDLLGGNPRCDLRIGGSPQAHRRSPFAGGSYQPP